ncbi:MAG: MBL fold metallo-hydrolase [Peptococcaceae bacterium]|nr:MAG: MBL fold metallo-hydrolase [Peptococcaceae bacterium]
MSEEIKTINLGGVNCHIVETGDGYILIDTGSPTKRADFVKKLESAGCKPGNLKLIILTHGDYDHTGNAAYLRKKYGTKIAMHHDDSGMVERGDWNWNRKAKPDKFSIIFRIVSFLIRPGKFDIFKPDLTIGEGFALSEYGLDAKVLHIPGHSKGSVGILTSTGDLFCGDLLYNIGIGIPFIDNLADFNASVEKLKKLNINTVYPGHGKPFPMEKFLKNHRKNNKEEN